MSVSPCLSSSRNGSRNGSRPPSAASLRLLEPLEPGPSAAAAAALAQHAAHGVASYPSQSQLTSTRSDPLYHKKLRDQIEPNPRFVKMVDLRGY